jgi:hypothetical protein
MSRTWCSAKRVVSTALGTKAFPGAPRLEDALAVAPVLVLGPPVGASSTVEEAAALAAVVVFASGIVLAIEVSSLLDVPAANI